MNKLTMQKKLKSVVANIGDINLKRRIETIIEKLALKDKDRVLDCGCGDGLFLVAIREVSRCQLHGLDFDKKNLRLASQYLKGSSVKLKHGDVTKMPFGNQFFDKIYCTEVLEHVINDRKALAEIKRVLKKNGLLIVTVPNHNYPFLWDPINKILESVSGKYIQGGFWAGIWNKHRRLYYLNEITDLINQSGFQVKERLALTHYCLPFNHLILYALRQLLNSGILPEKLARTADKFRWQENNQAGLIRWGYRLLHQFDSLNNYKTAPGNSSVNNLIVATRI